MKSLGQISYESSPDDGGMANFGPWAAAPGVVQHVHEKMAKAVEREVLKRIRHDEAKANHQESQKPINNGGPAFPHPEIERAIDFGNGGFARIDAQSGMSLRDYFAGQAIQGAASLAESNMHANDANYHYHLSNRAYSFADAMIAARGGKEGA